MKIRLTENQYRRLLSEQKTSEELIDYDGGVHKKMGKKIDKFLSKLFIHIFETDKITPQKMEGPYEYGYTSLKKVISKVGNYNRHSSLILAHNYIKYFDLMNIDDLILRAKRHNHHIGNITKIDYVSPTGDLNIINQKFDDLALERVIENPKRGVGESTLKQLYNFGSQNKLCLEDSIKKKLEDDSLKPKIKTSYNNFHK